MRFRRINQKTINCIITREDMTRNGIVPGDLFEHKKEAMDFIKKVIRKAARAENVEISGEYGSMKITVLPDESVSLTFSAEIPAGGKDPEQDRENEQYLYSFRSMRNVLRCAEGIPEYMEPETSLYETEEGYALIVSRGYIKGTDFERFLLLLNEFGILETTHTERILSIKEHNKCLLRSNAMQQLKKMR